MTKIFKGLYPLLKSKILRLAQMIKDPKAIIPELKNPNIAPSVLTAEVERAPNLLLYFSIFFLLFE